MEEDLAAGIGRYVTLRPARVGRHAMQGRCPFHQEHTPSFVVLRSVWYCFGCGAQGTTLEAFRFAWWLQQAVWSRSQEES